MTEWTKVPGFEYLEVTRDGRVRTAAKACMKMTRWGAKHAHHFKERELTRRVSDNGYLRVHHQRDKKRGPLYVHRLVGLAFVSGFVPGYHINHINGVKLDNRPENLEWVPNETNVRHAWKSGLCNADGAKKLTPARVRAIRRLLASGAAKNTVALAAGLAASTISKIAAGETWQNISPD